MTPPMTDSDIFWAWFNYRLYVSGFIIVAIIVLSAIWSVIQGWYELHEDDDEAEHYTRLKL